MSAAFLYGVHASPSSVDSQRNKQIFEEQTPKVENINFSKVLNRDSVEHSIMKIIRLLKKTPSDYPLDSPEGVDKLAKDFLTSFLFSEFDISEHDFMACLEALGDYYFILSSPPRKHPHVGIDDMDVFFHMAPLIYYVENDDSSNFMRIANKIVCLEQMFNFKDDDKLADDFLILPGSVLDLWYMLREDAYRHYGYHGEGLAVLKNYASSLPIFSHLGIYLRVGDVLANAYLNNHMIKEYVTLATSLVEHRLRYIYLSYSNIVNKDDPNLVKEFEWAETEQKTLKSIVQSYEHHDLSLSDVFSIYFTLGELSLFLGDPDSAIEFFSKALEVKNKMNENIYFFYDPELIELLCYEHFVPSDKKQKIFEILDIKNNEE